MRSRLITQCSIAVGGLVISLVLAESASAAGRLAARVAARREAVALAAANAEAAAAVAAAHPTSSGSACCPQPCSTYRYRGHAPRCCCEPTVQTVLTIIDPCTCCPVDVPVCLPACCTGVPTVCSGQGLLGRCVLTYTWCCGYQVTLRIKRNGDLIVVAPRV